ncbi:GM15329 [Drosophila sechellia]|uniref:GM15329 n=1 Tax=Drosophila sechellia TaxID=7238 RepID=B4IBB1_DROSE|nr:GM15329 [Drosophila sechellia]
MMQGGELDLDSRPFPFLNALALCQHHQWSIYLAPAIEIQGAGQQRPAQWVWPTDWSQQKPLKQQQVISSAMGGPHSICHVPGHLSISDLSLINRPAAVGGDASGQEPVAVKSQSNPVTSRTTES